MKRNTFVLLGVLAVLIIVAYLVMQKPGERSSTGEPGEMLVTVDSVSVDRIEVTSPSISVVLGKKGVEWFVESPVLYKADQLNVATLIHSSKSLQKRNVVSSRPEKHSVFQVDSTGTLVRLMHQGTEQASFILGKAGSSYTELYARRSGSDDVVLVEGASSATFNRPAKEWRDRTILSVPRESIREIRYQYGDTTFVLAFRDSTWTIGKDSTQEGVVSTLLSSISNVQADDFVDTLAARPAKPAAQISYGGTQLTFFYVKGNEKYLVQSSASPQWFEMQNWRATQILMRKKDIVKPK